MLLPAGLPGMKKIVVPCRLARQERKIVASSGQARWGANLSPRRACPAGTKDTKMSEANDTSTPATSEALYTGHNIHPTYALRYDWTGWPTAGTSLPPTAGALARATAPAWEADGLRLLELRAQHDNIQILFSATPQVDPIFFCQRVKGRLQHALRQAGTPMTFSRKVSFRSLGENTSEVVSKYIQGQTDKEDLADPRYREILRQFTVQRNGTCLKEPSESNSGRYWYNLHVVLVVAGRFRITNPQILAVLRDAAFALADTADHQIATLSLMPNHIHMALRGNIEHTPQEIALAFQNSLARAAGSRIWQDGYYVGTFSEYALDAIRRLAD